MSKVKSVTIDNLTLETHHRYARDAEQLDRNLIKESLEIPSHSDIGSLQASFISHWELLFGIHLRNTPWAHFSAPPIYRKMRKHLFQHLLFPYFLLRGKKNRQEKDSSDEEGEGKEEEKVWEFLRKGLSKMDSLSEDDKKSLDGLFEMIKKLDSLLKYIHERRLQFQKG
jgi:hypothetical protein